MDAKAEGSDVGIGGRSVRHGAVDVGKRTLGIPNRRPKFPVAVIALGPRMTSSSSEPEVQLPRLTDNRVNGYSRCPST